MKKCCFIIPYYGKLPEALPVFLKSCAENPDFDWLLLTNDHREFAYPANFRVVYDEFADLQAKADRLFGFHVRLEKPYKLCDLKPAYGFLFEEYIRDYRFWGHCDIDTVMGKLGNFLTDELLEQYDKLFCLGHMTIYRNTPENNRVFMRPIDGTSIYRDSFTNPEITWFDEEYKDGSNINRIFLHEGLRVYQKDLSMNIHIGQRKFRRVEYVGCDASPDGYHLEEYLPASYLWDHGKILRMQEQAGKLVTEEFLYIHLQYRAMEFNQTVLDADTFRIVPDQFVAMKSIPTTLAQFRMTPKVSFSTIRIRRLLKRMLKIG